MTATALLRQHAEQQYAEELAELAKADDRPKPQGWKLSPWAVRLYLLGVRGSTPSPGPDSPAGASRSRTWSTCSESESPSTS